MSKRRGATLAGIFSLAFSCVLLLCGAGSIPVENLLPQGAMQGDLNAGGHNLTNAATVSAVNVAVSGSLTAPGLGSLAALSPTGTADSTHYLRGDGAWATVASGGGLLTIGTNATTYGFTYSGGTLEVSDAPNTNGGLAQFASDGSIGWLGTSDTGNYSIAIGHNSISTMGAVAIGLNANANSSDGGGGGVAIGQGAVIGGYGVAVGYGASSSSTSTVPVAIGFFSTVSGQGSAVGYGANASDGFAGGDGASETGGGCAAGTGVHATSGSAAGSFAQETGGGVAAGAHASATTGVAAGNNTTETGGGANFCGGSYGGTGLAITADEVAVSNGSGYSTLSGRDDGTTPTNTSTPVGWIHVHVNGVNSWIPYYQ